jgi:hypothetical protein
VKARVYQTRAFAVSASENALAVEEAAVKGQASPAPP